MNISFLTPVADAPAELSGTNRSTPANTEGGGAFALLLAALAGTAAAPTPDVNGTPETTGESAQDAPAVPGDSPENEGTPQEQPSAPGVLVSVVPPEESAASLPMPSAPAGWTPRTLLVVGADVDIPADPGLSAPHPAPVSTVSWKVLPAPTMNDAPEITATPSLSSGTTAPEAAVSRAVLESTPTAPVTLPANSMAAPPASSVTLTRVMHAEALQPGSANAQPQPAPAATPVTTVATGDSVETPSPIAGIADVKADATELSRATVTVSQLAPVAKAATAAKPEAEAPAPKATEAAPASTPRAPEAAPMAEDGAHAADDAPASLLRPVPVDGKAVQLEPELVSERPGNPQRGGEPAVAALPAATARATAAPDETPLPESRVTESTPRMETAPAAPRASASAPSSTPAAQAAAPVEVPVMELGRFAARGVRQMLQAGGEQRMNFRIVPESLGEMQIEVTRNGNDVQVRLTAGNSAARELMEAQTHLLREALQREGFDAPRIQVTQQQPGGANHGSQRHEAPQQQQQGQPGGGHAPRHGAPGAQPERFPQPQRTATGGESLNIMV